MLPVEYPQLPAPLNSLPSIACGVKHVKIPTYVADRQKKTARGGPRQTRTADTQAGGDGVVYGVLPVLEALKSGGRRIEKVMVADGAREHRLAEIVALCRERSVPLTYAGRELLLRHAGPDANHQGVVALVAAAAYVSTDDILNSGGDPPLIVVLDGVEDPRNFGAILRVADGAGADGVVIPERRAVGLTDTVAKASAGAIEHVKVAKTQNLNRFIEELKARDIWVVGASDQAEIHYTAWDWMRPSALVLGGEGSGLHRLVAENCDMLVKIPMYGKIDSLNVSVAAGVILFEARRQRGAM